MSNHDLPQLDEGQFIRDFQALVLNGPALELELGGDVAFALMSTMQLAFRHPEFPPRVRDQITPFYACLQQYLSRTPALAAVIEAGEDPRYDVPAGTAEQASGPVTEVHNVWTIYGMNTDGSEVSEKLAMMSRPQDWGDPRWHYEQFRFEWARDDGHFINHFHGWTDLKREPWEYPQLFASLIVQIAMLGTPAQLCGRDFLAEEDFWDRRWGKEPPVFEQEEDYGGWNGSWEAS